MALETNRLNPTTERRDRDDTLGREDTHSSRTSTTAKTVATGSGGEALAGAGAMVLAIIALAGVYPIMLTSIAVIAAGAAFLFQGAAIAVRYNNASAAAGGGATGEGELIGGSSSEFIGGLGCIVLGILALVGVAPISLLAVSAIVFGGASLLGSPAVYRATGMGDSDVGDHQTARQVTTHATVGASGAQALIGIGAATLGILALVGVAPRTLVEVAVLSVGAAALLSGGALASKMVAMLSR